MQSSSLVAGISSSSQEASSFVFNPKLRPESGYSPLLARYPQFEVRHPPNYDGSTSIFYLGEITVICHSKPSSPNTAYACYVPVGMSAGPYDKPGLAHLVEHSCTFGLVDEGEGGYFAKARAVGGESNAYTYPDYTCYAQSVPKDQASLQDLSGFLKRFHPNAEFDSKKLIGERASVQKEYMELLVSYYFRLTTLYRAIAPKGHPAAKLFVGCEESLELDGLVDAAKVFIDTRYSKFLISLVGPQSLSTLTAWATEAAGPLADIVDSSEPSQPVAYKELSLPMAVDIESLDVDAPTTLLDMHFILDLPEKQRIDRLHILLCRVISQKCPGGLYHYLKNKGYISSLSADSDKESRKFGEDKQVVQVLLKLTPLGLSSKSDVVQAVLGYASFLASEEMPEHYYQTIHSAYEEYFDNVTNFGSSYKIALMLGRNVDCFGGEYALSGLYHMAPYSETTVSNLQQQFSQLTAERLLVITESPKEKLDAAAAQTPFMNLSYEQKPEEALSIREMSAQSAEFNFSWPQPNHFSPHASQLIAQPSPTPTIALDLSRLKLWSWPFTLHKVPEAGFAGDLLSARLRQPDRRSLLMRALLVSVLGLKLEYDIECFRYRKLAVSVSAYQEALHIHASGKDHLVPIAVELIMAALKETCADNNIAQLQALLGLAKTKLLEKIIVAQKYPLHLYAKEQVLGALDPYYLNIRVEDRGMIDNISPAEFQQYAASVWDGKGLVASYAGNVASQTLEGLSRSLERIFPDRAQEESVSYTNISPTLPSGFTVVTQPLPRASQNAVCLLHFKPQVDKRTLKSALAFEFIAQQLYPAYLQEFRTDRGFAYKVVCEYSCGVGDEVSAGVDIGFVSTPSKDNNHQSKEVVPSQAILAMTLKFLRSFEKQLISSSENKSLKEKLDMYKSDIIARNLKPYETLNDGMNEVGFLSRKRAAQVPTSETLPAYRERVVRVVQTITHDEILQVYKDCFLENPHVLVICPQALADGDISAKNIKNAVVEAGFTGSNLAICSTGDKALR